jgi:hypothetical protein
MEWDNTQRTFHAFRTMSFFSSHTDYWYLDTVTECDTFYVMVFKHVLVGIHGGTIYKTVVECVPQERCYEQLVLKPKTQVWLKPDELIRLRELLNPEPILDSISHPIWYWHRGSGTLTLPQDWDSDCDTIRYESSDEIKTLEIE